MGNLGKRMTEALASMDGKENLSIEEAVSLVKENAKAKFDETIEIAMNLGVDTRHADQMVRGVVGLPNGTGKSVRVAVLREMQRRTRQKLQVPTLLVRRT